MYITQEDCVGNSRSPFNVKALKARSAMTWRNAYPVGDKTIVQWLPDWAVAT
jgi:hypothetical protein